MTVELKELEFAVCDVIQIIKQIPELAEARLAVIGDLALCHYLPDHRPTDVRLNFSLHYNVFFALPLQPFSDSNSIREKHPTDSVSFQVINFITNLPTLELLRKKLLKHPNSPFTKSKQALFYHSPAGRVIQIKFSPQWLVRTQTFFPCIAIAYPLPTPHLPHRFFSSF